MNRGKPVLVCATLALAAHATLLLGDGRTPRSAATGAPPVSTRYLVESAEPAVAAPVPAEDKAAAADTPPTRTAETQNATAAAPSPDAEPPAFEETAPPRIGFPDAQLPADGVLLRAYVELESDGSPRHVSAASPPGATPPPLSFQKVTEHALKQARFKPGLGSAYCLLVRFEPDTPAPTLAWLPDAARDVSRCLAGAAPPPRDIDMAATP